MHSDGMSTYRYIFFHLKSLRMGNLEDPEDLLVEEGSQESREHQGVSAQETDT